MQQNLTSLRELLTWYADAGVDVALLDDPINRFEEAAQKKISATKPPQPIPRMTSPVTGNPNPSTPRNQPIVPDSGVVELAKKLAQDCQSLAQLKDTVEKFEGCNLKFSARSTVFCDGNPNAPIMLVGEAPGRDEDAQGLPFVGRSGQLLDKMLAAIGFSRDHVYISNILPWRPPGNRTPTPAESEICRPFIEKHIELAAPEILILVGGSSAKTLLRSKNGIMSLRGKWQDVEVAGRAIPSMPILHPAYLLRNPAHKKLAWNDLQKIQSRCEEIGKPTDKTD